MTQPAVPPNVIELEVAPPTVVFDTVAPTVEVEVDSDSATVQRASEKVIVDAGPTQVVFAAVPGARGPAGPGGSGSVVIGAPLTGTQDGVNLDFTLPDVYMAGSTGIYRNGLRERRGIDYTESNPILGTITFTTAPQSDDDLTADYTVS
jgi:hypothetical protein